MLINDRELAVTVTGEGRAFIWAHGLMSSVALDAQSHLFDLGDLGGMVKLVRYDALGHGQSEGSQVAEDYRWPSLAADMVGIADSLGIERFVAGGPSLGCATSLFAALAAPQRVEGLVLVTPPTAWKTRQAQGELYMRMADFIQAQGAEALLGILKQRPLLPRFLLEELPEMEEVFLSHIGSLDESILPHLFRGAALSDLPSREEVQTLKMPTLILAWADDEGHPLSTAEQLDNLLPDSRLHIAGSLTEIREWSRLIRDFISGLP